MALSFHFVNLFNSGQLALSERPKFKEVKKLVPAGCDRVVTILSAKGEQAHKIGEAVESAGMAWEWLKVSHATSITEQEVSLFRTSVRTIFERINTGESVLVHCSAGLHRTGMFAYALLRSGNLQHDESLKLIKEIRPATYQALEEKYIEIASRLY